MPRIGQQHAWKDAGHKLVCSWPNDCLVQWGSSGVVLSSKGNYRTAFFEVFFENSKSGSFIRGEGVSIEDAERDAFAKYEEETACEHLWGREGYLNGGQKCRHCRAFRCDSAKPVVTLGHMRAPLSRWEASTLLEDTEEYQAELESLGIQRTADMSRLLRQLQIRAKLFGFKREEDAKEWKSLIS